MIYSITQKQYRSIVEAASPAQQAAIAINMKKKGIKPKNESLYEIEEEDEKGWDNSNSKLQKTFKFKDFKEAINFVNKIAKIAESQNHHPEINIDYDKVKISIFDHDKGKVSEKCHKFVGAVDKLNENNTSVELQERCWKGYTQKGMKTMFGKRYPNCVKVKK